MDRRERGSDLDEALRAAMNGERAEIWTALPGRVVTMDYARQTCSFQPGIRARVQDERGDYQWVTMPLLLDCPVHFPKGGGVTLTFPVKPGDEGLAVIASRCIDGWWQLGGVQVQPDLRMHDLSDGMVYVGFSSLPSVIPSISATAAQLRNDAGTCFVELVAASGNIRARTTGTFTADADGAVLIKSAASITLQAPQILSQGAASFTVQAPAISMQGNMTWVGYGGGAGTVGVSNMNISYSSSFISYTGGTVTHDGKNIGSTHTHFENGAGSNTNAPNP